jgi:high-affinity K+ transport system ATPase subunit B
MFVKVTTRYKDSQLLAELPAGVILEVSDERARALIDAKVAEEFTFPASEAKQKNKKSEETKVEIKEEDIVAVEETNEVPAEAEVVDTTEVTTKEEEDAWKEPEATETTGE